MTILSGHQPCYLPSLQLFAKMAKSNVFMLCGHLQFQRKSWHHRNYIWLNGKRHRLSIPIRGPHDQLIRDAWFTDDSKWKEKHLKTIALAYGDYPFFEVYYPTLKEIFYSHPHSLEQLNAELTITIARWLGVKTAIRDSAFWSFEGDAVDKIIQMCKAVDADRYLSNEGAKSYISPIEEKRLEDAGIWHQWLTFADPDGSEPLSAIHHLCAWGPAASELIQPSLGSSQASSGAKL